MSIPADAASGLIVQSEGYLVSDMNGEKVMLSIENGKYYNLGEVGGHIWELLASPTTVADMVRQLVNEYEVEPEACERQVREFVGQLQAEGLVRAARG